jgi:hypothetical protein
LYQVSGDSFDSPPKPIDPSVLDFWNTLSSGQRKELIAYELSQQASDHHTVVKSNNKRPHNFSEGQIVKKRKTSDAGQDHDNNQDHASQRNDDMDNMDDVDNMDVFQGEVWEYKYWCDEDDATDFMKSIQKFFSHNQNGEQVLNWYLSLIL